MVLHARVAAIVGRGLYRGPPSKCCIAGSVLRSASYQAERLAAPPWHGRVTEGVLIGGELTVAE